MITGAVPAAEYASWLDRAAVAVQLRRTHERRVVGDGRRLPGRGRGAGRDRHRRRTRPARPAPSSSVSPTVAPGELASVIADVLGAPDRRTALAAAAREHALAAQLRDRGARAVRDRDRAGDARRAECAPAGLIRRRRRACRGARRAGLRRRAVARAPSRRPRRSGSRHPSSSDRSTLGDRSRAARRATRARRLRRPGGAGPARSPTSMWSAAVQRKRPVRPPTERGTTSGSGTTSGDVASRRGAPGPSASSRRRGRCGPGARARSAAARRSRRAPRPRRIRATVPPREQRAQRARRSARGARGRAAPREHVDVVASRAEPVHGRDGAVRLAGRGRRIRADYEDAHRELLRGRSPSRRARRPSW